MILNSLNLPKEIIYHYIVPFSPCFHLSKSTLELQKKKINLLKFIVKDLLIEDEHGLKEFIFKQYDGGENFSFQNEEYFVSVDFDTNHDIKDYICMYFCNISRSYEMVL